MQNKGADFGGWAMYFEGHLSVTGSEDDVSGETIVQGSSYFSGSSLHSHAATSGGRMDLQLKSPLRNEQGVLTINKSTTTADYNEVGDVINYTITVQNEGNITLNNVMVTDSIIQTLTQTGGNDDDGKMNVGEIWTYTGSYTVTQSDLDVGEVINTATADSNETDPVTDEVTVNGIQDPSMTIDKTANRTTYREAGDVINYTITVDNTGNITLTNVVVTDPMLGTLTGPSGDTDNDNKLDVNETWTYAGSYTVLESDIVRGSITNTATADSDQTEKITDDLIITVLGENTPEISIVKSADETTYDSVGDVIHYTITVENIGNVPLTNIAVTDPMLNNLLYNSGDTNGDNILDITETWVYKGSYTVNQDDLESGLINNTALVNSDQTKPLSDSLTINGIKRPLMTIDKVADKSTYKIVGDVINYTITVRNTGNISLTNITVIDNLIGEGLAGPSGDTDGDNKLDVTETWTYTGSYTVVNDDIVNKSIKNTATAVSLETSPINDEVTVSLYEPGPGPGPGPGTDTDKPAMSIKKDADVKTYSTAGDEIKYTITVKNTGNIALTNVEVIDALLDDLALESGDKDNDGKLDTNETWIYTGSYTVVDSDIANGSIKNTATADTNETAKITDSVTVTLSDEPVVIIDDTDTPLGGGTVIEPPAPEPEDTVIEEPTVPLATLPDTGKVLNTTILIVIGSIMVLAGLILNRKKGRIF